MAPGKNHHRQQDVSVSVSVLTLTAISIDRYYAICHPLKFKSSLNQAKRIIALIWLVSLAIMTPDLIYLRAKRSKDLTDAGLDTVLYSDCNHDWSEEASRAFQFVKTILLYLLPFMLMFWAHYQILQVLRLASSMAYGELKVVGPNALNGAGNNRNSNSNSSATDHQLAGSQMKPPIALRASQSQRRRRQHSSVRPDGLKSAPGSGDSSSSSNSSNCGHGDGCSRIGGGYDEDRKTMKKKKKKRKKRKLNDERSNHKLVGRLAPPAALYSSSLPTDLVANLAPCDSEQPKRNGLVALDSRQVRFSGLASGSEAHLKPSEVAETKATGCEPSGSGGGPAKRRRRRLLQTMLLARDSWRSNELKPVAGSCSPAASSPSRRRDHHWMAAELLTVTTRPDVISKLRTTSEGLPSRLSASQVDQHEASGLNRNSPSRTLELASTNASTAIVAVTSASWRLDPKAELIQLTMHNKSKLESRQKAAKMLTAIVVLFGLCYLPVHLINFLR